MEFMKLKIPGFKDLTLRGPIGTASGTSGNGEEFGTYSDIRALGFFTTKTVTLEPRPGNDQPRIDEVPEGALESFGFPGRGMRNSIGLKNEGVDMFVKNDLRLLRPYRTHGGLRIVVNISGFSVEEFREVAMRVCTHSRFFDILEVNISCLNVDHGNATFGTDADVAAEVVRAVKSASGDVPVFVKLTPAAEDIGKIAQAILAAGANGITAINTVPVKPEWGLPELGKGYGGLSGPIIRDIALQKVREVREAVGPDVPIIGVGGVTDGKSARHMLRYANLVAVGSASFVDPMTAPNIAKTLSQEEEM